MERGEVFVLEFYGDYRERKAQVPRSEQFPDIGSRDPEHRANRKAPRYDAAFRSPVCFNFDLKRLHGGIPAPDD